jgi:hypothetical protein
MTVKTFSSELLVLESARGAGIPLRPFIGGNETRFYIFLFFVIIPLYLLFLPIFTLSVASLTINKKTGTMTYYLKWLIGSIEKNYRLSEVVKVIKYSANDGEGVVRLGFELTEKRHHDTSFTVSPNTLMKIARFVSKPCEEREGW